MQKLAILLGKPSVGAQDDETEEDQEETDEGEAGYEMFLAWCESMGLTPKDPEKAYHRMCALSKIWGSGGFGGGY